MPLAGGSSAPQAGAGRPGARGAECMEQPMVAYQQDAFWGIPLRDQAFVETAAAFYRPGTAEMSCWQTACAQWDFAKSWVGG